MKYCFVILHYLALSDTIECVNSIRTMYGNRNDWHIVIVDNASWNNTGTALYSTFEMSEDVDVVLMHNNEGFARGNNAGYIYAKSKFNPGFIIVINNDVVFTDPLFLDNIDSIYKEEKFDVLGPDILDRTGKVHTSPMSLSLRSYKEYRRSINKLQIAVNALEKKGIWILINRGLQFIGKLKASYKHNKQSTNADYYKTEHRQCVLQGACFIFSELYINSYDDAFCPDTFLYHEEHLLLYRIIRDRKKLLYSPKLYLIHKEDVATDMEMNTASSDKILFKLKEEIKSRKIIMRMMEEDAKEVC